MAVFKLLALGAGTLLLIYWLKLRKSKFERIPEPPCNFLLGHALSLRGHIPKTFLEWKKSVGPVFQVRIFNFRALVLNDKESIAKVCSKPETAGRWIFGLFRRITELFGTGVGFGDGPATREQRDFYMKSFRTVGFGRSKLDTGILKEIDQVVQNWTATKGEPFELDGAATCYSANAAWNLLGSRRFSEEEVEKIDHCVHSAVTMDTLHQRLNVFFPNMMEKVSSTARDLARGWGRVLVGSCRDVIESHFKDRIPNEPRDVIDMMLDRMDSTEDVTSAFHQNNLKHAFQMPEVLSASIHTTARALEWFLLYLGKHSEVQKKLQSEIEEIAGPTKDPVQLHLRDQMPYAQACIYEAFRLGSVTPLAMTHRAMEDFQFQGATIPQGTIILPNLYAAHYDPETWTRPEDFNPERFLTPEGQLDASVTKNVIAFGVGRRSCIGSTVAMDMLFLFVTNVFKKFEVQVPNCPENIQGPFGLIISPPAGLKIKAVLRS